MPELPLGGVPEAGHGPEGLGRSRLMPDHLLQLQSGEGCVVAGRTIRRTCDSAGQLTGVTSPAPTPRPAICPPETAHGHNTRYQLVKQVGSVSDPEPPDKLQAQGEVRIRHRCEGGGEQGRGEAVAEAWDCRPRRPAIGERHGQSAARLALVVSTSQPEPAVASSSSSIPS